MRLLLLFLLSALASVGATAGPVASTAATSGATSAVHAREDNVKHPKGLRGAVGILDVKHPARANLDEERFVSMTDVTKFVIGLLKKAGRYVDTVPPVYERYLGHPHRTRRRFWRGVSL